MTVGGPGRLLPAGGSEDGRFPEGAPRVQQEQLQQVPCGFRLQGLQPPALGVFAHQRIPLGADYRDREDKHPPALPPPAVGQKECCQEAGPGAGGSGGGELGPSPENRPDRQPGHDRGHLKPTKPTKTNRKNPGIREFPKLFPPFFGFFPPPSFFSPLGIPGICPIYLGFASFPGFFFWGGVGGWYLWHWDFFMERGNLVGPFFPKIPRFFSWDLLLRSPRIYFPKNSHFFFLGFSLNRRSPRGIPYSQKKITFFFLGFIPFPKFPVFPGIPGF